MIEACNGFDLLIAKLEAYGLDREMVKLIYSYLKDRKQAVKVKRFCRHPQINYLWCATRVHLRSNTVQYFHK